MDTITYDQISEENFSVSSLDGFIRRQEVRECWRKVDGQWKLLPIAYVEDWDLEARRVRAERILRGIRSGGVAYGAWRQGSIVGFARLALPAFGSENQYIDLAQLHVSEPFRRLGIGGKLFRLACQGARELGASRLYISAHSAKESAAAYRKYGCVEAEEINQSLAEKEPCDMQLEFRLENASFPLLDSSKS